MKTKILLDTDIGTDVDDAVCLAYLLLHPECDLLGITTVTGEAERRAMLASVLCMLAGRDIPIYPGAVDPLLVPQQQREAAQAEVLPRWPHRTAFPRGEAVEFLRHTIRANPGEVVLLTISPLTNIGLLFSADPEIPSLLKGLVMMCGKFMADTPGYAPLEWNAIGDPHATAIVYRAPVTMHRSIGLDVTARVTMTPQVFRDSFRHELFKPVFEMGEIWFRQWDAVTFHDPLAAATIFKGDLCRFQEGNVSIELGDGDARGRTDWRPGGEHHSHEIAVDVDVPGFFKHYRSVVP